MNDIAEEEGSLERVDVMKQTPYVLSIHVIY